jgi:sugar phosphate isomerase/epimerase
MSVSGIGIFARSFPRTSPADVADAVRRSGFTLVQFNFSAIGLTTLSAAITPGDLQEVAREFQRHGISIWGLSATYNMINPDLEARNTQTRGAARLIGMSDQLGVEAVTLCTGTRNLRDIWTGHRGNRSPEAWRDLRATLDVLLPAAAAAKVRLGIEPEPGNVIADARQARRLLGELGADAAHAGVVLDRGNLVTPGTLGRQHDIIAHAFSILAEHIIGLQAKDIHDRGPAPLGQGQLDHDLIIAQAQQLARPVPVIIQDATEQDAARSGAFLRARIEAASRA